jgi:hypothetical protein
MPFTALNEADKHAFMTHLADRGRPATTGQDTKDLVVGEGAHVTLSASTAKQHQIEIRRPASADELSKWIGVAARVRDNPAFRLRCFRDNAILDQMLRRTKLLERKVPDGKTLRQLIADDRDAQDAFSALGRLYVVGRLSVHPRWPLYILEEINGLTQSVDVYFGTWVDIVVKAGATLEFGPPGPYSVVAHSLTVEAGGKIVTDKAHVSYDCTYLTIQ